MTNKLIPPVKGTRDFYPEDFAFQKWYYSKIQQLCQNFGFLEYEGPTIEYLDLYAAKSGEELVKRQAFTLKDRKGETLVLRPEMTPSLARLVAQKENEINFPAKWFTYGRRFRYEQPQRGRAREFFQWDCDILGLESVQADAEVITIAATMYKLVGLTPQEAVIKINDRQYVQSSLLSFGIPQEKHIPVTKVIDKKDKVPADDFKAMLAEEGLDSKQQTSILAFLEDKKGYLTSPWLTELFELLKATSIFDYIVFDPSIVRGLDYYTRTVFEGWDVKGEFRSIWGGGRYDNLTADIGATRRIPGVGFAMGDMTIAEVLKVNNKYPQLNPNPTKALVTVFSPDLYSKSQDIAKHLRQQLITTEIYLDPIAKLDKQIKYADKKGIPYVVIIGPEEVEKGVVTLKNLATHEQQTVKPEDIASAIRDKR